MVGPVQTYTGEINVCLDASYENSPLQGGGNTYLTQFTKHFKYKTYQTEIKLL